MTSQPVTEVIHLIFTSEDVLDIAEDLRNDGEDIADELAMDRALGWARSIENTATALIENQLRSCIQFDTP